MSDDRPEPGFQLYDVRIIVLNLPDADLDDLDEALTAFVRSTSPTVDGRRSAT